MSGSEALDRLCSAFVQVPSVSGREGEFAQLVRRSMLEAGFDSAWQDRFGNVIGQVGDGTGPRVLFDGHLDTVEVVDPTQWTVDPHGGTIRGGRLYGRGSSDMKGALAAMIHAVGQVAEDIRKNGGTVYVSGTVLEEVLEGVALGEVLKEVEPDVVIIGEATALRLNLGQRGRAEVVVETHGIPAHSSNPERGVNAVYKLLPVIEELRRLEPPNHPVLGNGIMELTDISSSPFPGTSVVPERCRATFDRRLLVGETEGTVLEPLQEVLDCFPTLAGERDSTVNCMIGQETTYTGEVLRARRFFPGWLFGADEPFVQVANAALQQAGLPGTPGHYSFCTNGSQSAGRLGIPTLGFGPSREDLAHVVDEYIDLEQVHLAARGYAALATALTGSDAL